MPEYTFSHGMHMSSSLLHVVLNKQLSDNYILSIIDADVLKMTLLYMWATKAQISLYVRVVGLKGT